MHPWAQRGRRPVSARQLAATPLVVREVGSGTRTVLERALADHQMASPVLEFSSTMAVRSAVAAGAGPAVLGRHAVRDDLNHRAPRVMAVLEPLRVTLTNLDTPQTLSLPYWPHDVVRDSPDGLVGLPGGGRVEPEQAVRDVLLTAAGAIPRTSSGKIARRACKAAYIDGTLRGGYQQTAFPDAPHENQ